MLHGPFWRNVSLAVPNTQQAGLTPKLISMLAGLQRISPSLETLHLIQVSIRRARQNTTGLPLVSWLPWYQQRCRQCLTHCAACAAHRGLRDAGAQFAAPHPRGSWHLPKLRELRISTITWDLGDAALASLQLFRQLTRPDVSGLVVETRCETTASRMELMGGCLLQLRRLSLGFRQPDTMTSGGVYEMLREPPRAFLRRCMQLEAIDIL